MLNVKWVVFTALATACATKHAEGKDLVRVVARSTKPPRLTDPDCLRDRQRTVVVCFASPDVPEGADSTAYVESYAIHRAADALNVQAKHVELVFQPVRETLPPFSAARTHGYVDDAEDTLLSEAGAETPVREFHSFTPPDDARLMGDCLANGFDPTRPWEPISTEVDPFASILSSLMKACPEHTPFVNIKRAVPAPAGVDGLGTEITFSWIVQGHRFAASCRYSDQLDHATANRLLKGQVPNRSARLRVRGDTRVTAYIMSPNGREEAMLTYSVGATISNEEARLLIGDLVMGIEDAAMCEDEHGAYPIDLAGGN